jgi:1,4-alpha-glucan branching enzyme
VFAFVRRARDGSFVVAVCNFTPVVREGYRLGVPAPGSYREIINTDGAVYGGSGVGNGVLASEPVRWQGRADSLVMTVPPLATVMWVLA